MFLGMLLSATPSLGARAFAQNYEHLPWLTATVPIVLKISGDSEVDWDKMLLDRRVKAVVHRASDGTVVDPKFVARAREAKAKGLLWGAFHVARPGDNKAQADLLLGMANATGTKFLAIDLDDDPAKTLVPWDANRFVYYVHDRMTRYPAVHVSYATYVKLSAEGDVNWAFAKAPLWIVRPEADLRIDNARVWESYSFWQFADTASCNAKQPCPYKLSGISGDAKISVFRGDEQALRKLFD